MKIELVRGREWLAKRLAADGGTVAVCIGLAFGAWSTIPLRAAVIDDFEGPLPKWTCGGSGCDYLGPTQAFGRLVFSGQFPPIQDNRDNVYWPASLPVGDLNARTLELRMDLVGLTGEGHFFMLGAQGVGGYYLVARSQDEVMLAKWTSTGSGHSVLFLEEAAVKYENTTVVLALAPVGDTLQISVRLLNKDSSNAVLWEHSFRDTQATDVAVPTNRPPGFYIVPDQGAPLMNAELAWAGVVFMGTGAPPPVELVVDNLQYDLYDAPGLAIEKSVHLSWSANTAEKQIVVGAESPAGPWVPCLEPIFNRNGCLCISVPITHNDQWLKLWNYFKLVPGSQFADDFSGQKEAWVPLYIQGDNSQFTFNSGDGVLRLKAETGAAESWGFLAPPGPDLVYTDLAMSVDILDWDPTAWNQEVALAARGTVDRQNPGAAEGYLGYLVIKEMTSGGQSRLCLYSDPPNADLRSLELDLDPQNAYRLVFSAVGTQLTLELFQLDAMGQPVTLTGSISVTDSRHSRGSTGLWWLHRGQTFDVTIDNFFVSGTSPLP